MARAYPASQPSDYRQEPQGEEWSALRGELVALLDEVESQVARTRQRETGYQSIAERMDTLRYQVANAAEPDTRHREALRSVKRAVDRFNERDEPFAPPPQYEPHRQQGYAPNPRDTLQSAIQQIRARHPEVAPGAAHPARMMESPRFDELAQAVGGLSGRLERLEAELRAQGKSQTGNVKEIAEQVGQLSHVVELLAGAVGETGQVKRLEGQIAGLARLVADGPKADLAMLGKRIDETAESVAKLIDRGSRETSAHNEGMSQRLDDVTTTMGRLADLQVQFANRVEASANAIGGLKDGLRTIEGRVEASADANGGLREGMRAIEESVRNIYDRIDAIEKNTSLSAVDVDKLTDEMARFTEAMKNPVQPQGLIELVDALNTRIATLETREPASVEVSGLKLDVEDLREAVISAMEPRFTAIEMQIEALSDRVGERPSGADISVGQLEAQVRQLVARMDQTGEQLTGLARLYSQPAEPAPAPDFEALADLVAARTSEAVAQNAPPLARPVGGLSDDGIDEIERRISRLVNAAAMERPSEDFAGIENSIREVGDRLARLESSLTARAEEAARIAALPVQPVVYEDTQKPDPAPSSSFRPMMPEVPTSSEAEIGEEPPVSSPSLEDDPIAPLLAEAEAAAIEEAKSETATAYYPATPGQSPARDAMPTSPDEDAPLVDRPFTDQNPVKAALDAKNGPRKQHPGLSYQPLPGQGVDLPPAATAEPRPNFNPATIERPPRPTSAFETPAREVFAEPPVAEPLTPMAASESMTAAPEPDVAADTTPSANTFIAAARRAAQRQQGPSKGGAGSSGSGSLIARAFASFQATNKPAAEKTETAAKPAKPKKEKKGRKLAGDKDSPTAWAPDDDAAMVEPKLVTPAAAESTLPPAPASDLATPALRSLDQEATAPSVDKPKTESVFVRYRRPILLAATVVAVALLALNLVVQRLNEAEPVPSVEPSSDTSAIEPESIVPSELTGTPMADVAAVSGPRVIPIVDSLATASIDAGAAQGFTPTSEELPSMPAAFTAANLSAPGKDSAIPADGVVEEVASLADSVMPMADELASPVMVDLPPEALGPEPLRRAAAEGDARAQFEIAAIYTEGRAVPEDLEAAAVWYERAAAQGFAPAQYRLGNLYENGRGVAKDLAQAKLWYQRAAEAGNRMAMHNLAALYAGGDLGKQEFDAAAQWFEQAALRGMRDSQFNLGMLYARGLGVAQSLEESYKWFSMAAARGDADAAKARDDVARSLDADTVSRLNGELDAFEPASVDLVANFAPIGTWSDKFDPGETITNRDVIKSVQAALGALGYDVGTPDGLAGPKTEEAIRAFERTTGMSESGAVNPRLLAVLGSQPV